jgi:heme A synthase
MIEKNWLQQDYILIGFTRGAFILLILAILLYTLLWHKLGEWKANGALKRFWWRWFWWVGYYGKR